MLLLAFIGGVLTILSPCILPVIPLAFAARGKAFARETAPMLAGLATSFAATAAIGATAAHWLASAAAIGRVAAVVVVAFMGIALLVPEIAGRLLLPVVRVGASLSTRAAPVGERPSSAAHALLGVAIGMLWAPCAGPILALLVTATARESWSASANALLAFALGGAASLGAVLWLGNRASTRLAAVRAYEHAIRRATGALALTSALLIATGWDRSVFRLADFVTTAHAETVLLSTFGPKGGSGIGRQQSPEPDVGTFLAGRGPVRSIRGLTTEERPMPGFDGATAWINSAPLTADSLRGKVVLVDFWTFACYNCLNALPHVKALYEKYREQGFVVIGVHTPELPQERPLDNVEREVKRLGITYPVVVDNDYAIWNAYHNQYWPAAYYADATGALRFSHFGEGAYSEQDKAVALLLEETTHR